MGVRMNNFIKKGKMGARMTKICKKRGKMGVRMNKLRIKDENGS